MRLILQRVTRAAVTINDEKHQNVRRESGAGYMILVGITQNDDDATAVWMAEKAANLRVFGDDEGNMNRSLLDVNGAALIVSQFTLYADSRKGRRPSFIGAATPGVAIPLYNRFVDAVRAMGVPVETGEFGADMQVELTNDGPVTIILDSAEIMPRL
jgi:D-tyrosyl-tRNA(Tyr) deacylase